VDAVPKDLSSQRLWPATDYIDCLMRPLLATLLCAAPLLLAPGCSGDQSQSNGLLTRTLGNEGEMAGIVSGTLQVDSDRGCVLVSGSAVVWPAGTTLAGEPPEIHLPGGQRARPGDTVVGGGGEIPGASIRDTALRIEGDLTHALGCAPADSIVRVFNARGEAMSVNPDD
jgi:hypothetical protein